MNNFKPFRRSMLYILALIAYSTTGLAETDLEHGKAMFRLCTQCHGEQGQGQKSIEAPAIGGLPAWYVEAQVQKFRNGVRGLHPKDLPGLRMRPMAKMLKKDEDVKAVAAYVATLPVKKETQTVMGDPDAGKKQFEVCISCHGAQAEGNQAVGAPPLTTNSDWYLLTQLKNFKAGLRGADATVDATGNTMRNIANILTEKSMHDLVDHIYNLKPQK